MSVSKIVSVDPGFKNCCLTYAEVEGSKITHFEYQIINFDQSTYKEEVIAFFKKFIADTLLVEYQPPIGIQTVVRNNCFCEGFITGVASHLNIKIIKIYSGVVAKWLRTKYNWLLLPNASKKQLTRAALQSLNIDFINEHLDDTIINILYFLN